MKVALLALFATLALQFDAAATGYGDGSLGSSCTVLSGTVAVGSEGEIGAASSGTTLICPLFPENGIALNALSVNYYDNSSTAGHTLTVEAIRRSATATADSETVMASFASTGTGSSWRNAVVNFSHTVVRRDYVYYLRIDMGTATSATQIGFRGALVKNIP